MHDLNNHPIIQKYNTLNRFGDLVNMSFHIEEPGIVRYTLEVSESLLATPNAIHGGVISALCDAVLGVGALSLVCINNKVVSTVEMKVSFLNPALLGDVLIGKSKVLKEGNRLIFMDAEIYNQNITLIASASGTFNAYPAEKAGY